ncbi:hypothetical protein BT96DRAFT_996708 [Gymnopus androsaceus JB14]|uniref:AB hydrolase-1 domain-containing protein n=1 Tax=Gymnopus androsaceus JB14 TaxID=1447944 RepID=A0A6A4HDL4_9AGAR|nr:hypothetical protein BT96DRAFT_996708 [Gymnopus androsaceus JB14]
MVSVGNPEVPDAQLIMTSITAEKDVMDGYIGFSSSSRPSKRDKFIATFILGLVLTVLYVIGREPSPLWKCANRKSVVAAPGNIHWGECIPAVDNVECGRIVVPKDYFNPDAGTATIALGRYKAKKLPRKGSVFLNPGGPGGAGSRMAIAYGAQMAKLIGDDWDLVGFDPRGIGKTRRVESLMSVAFFLRYYPFRPVMRCFSSPLSKDVFFANTVIEQGITVSSISNLSSPLLYDELVEQHRQLLALKETQAELCRKNMGDELRYMGTATVVRDIDFMSKIIEGEHERINYWGGSYGSILGAYLVNMLPNRIGYAVIDGIADPINWSNEPSHKWPINWAGPSRCPLAKYKGEPWQNLERRFEEFFDETARKPIPVPFGNRPGFLTSGGARGGLRLRKSFHLPWPETQRIYTTFSFPRYTFEDAGPNQDLARLAVTCLDSPRPASPEAFPTAEDLAEQGLKALREVSPHFGLSTGVSEPDGGCQYWPVDGPERFTGPWNATLETKMLIVSNTADPITPKSSGLLINSLMPNSSVIIIQDGPGHTSTALPSLCTAKLQRGYFAGDIPKNGTVCSVDVATFPDEEDEAILQMLSIEDRELLKALKDIEAGKEEPVVKSESVQMGLDTNVKRRYLGHGKVVIQTAASSAIKYFKNAHSVIVPRQGLRQLALGQATIPSITELDHLAITGDMHFGLRRTVTGGHLAHRYTFGAWFVNASSMAAPEDQRIGIFDGKIVRPFPSERPIDNPVVVFIIGEIVVHLVIHGLAWKRTFWDLRPYTFARPPLFSVLNRDSLKVFAAISVAMLSIGVSAGRSGLPVVFVYPFFISLVSSSGCRTILNLQTLDSMTTCEAPSSEQNKELAFTSINDTSTWDTTTMFERDTGSRFEGIS